MLGVCYYPEQWPEAFWEDDAARMRALGLTYVRIAEFAWTKMEPEPGRYDFGWLDKAVQILGGAGLKVVLGTPTATPPKWLVDRYPDILLVDQEGRRKRHGGRRHADLASANYWQESKRIVTVMAERYGENPHVAGWQVDNEFGCHDTTLSYSEAARRLPPVAREALRQHRGPERGVGKRLLEHDLSKLRRDRGAEPCRRRSGAGASARFPPLTPPPRSRPMVPCRWRSCAATRPAASSPPTS
jgi:beta-galactosidase GanA